MKETKTKLSYVLVLVLLAGVCGFWPAAAKAGATCDDCLTTNKSSYIVGEAIKASLKNVTPNAPIYWTVYVDGENRVSDAYFNETTDSNGSFTWDDLGVATVDSVGKWQITAEAGNIQATTKFEITASTNPKDNPPDQNNKDVAAGHSHFNNFSALPSKFTYNVGDKPSFAISGAPANSAVYWHFYHNGTDMSDYLPTGGVTDANGSWQGGVGLTFTGSSDSGSYMVAFKIAGELGFANFVVGSSSISLSDQNYPHAAVKQAYSGTVTFTYTGTTVIDVMVENIPNGLVVAEPFFKVTQDGETDYELDNVQPNSPIAVTLTGTPTKAGKFTLNTDFFSFNAGQNIDQRFDLRSTFLQVGEAGQEPASITFPSDVTIPADNSTPSAPSSSPAIAKGQAGIIKSDSGPAVYYINEQGWKILVPNMKVFSSYGAKASDIRTVSQAELDAFPTTVYIKIGSSARVYKVEGTGKRYLTPTAAANLKIDPGSVMIINKTEFSFYRSGSTIAK